MKQEQIWKFWKNGRREGTFFEVSNTGHVLKHYKNGTTNMCSPFLRKPQIRMGHSPILYVKVDNQDMNLARIIYEVWHGPIYADCRIIHKDGNYKNNHQANLLMVTKEEAGRIGSLRKRKGKPIYNAETGDIYRSSRDAALRSFISRQTALDYANGKVFSPLIPMMFEEDMRKVAAAYKRVRNRGSFNKKNKFEVIANALTPEQYENLMENIELLCWDEKAKAYY